MKTRIVKSRDSLALRIPKAIAEAAQLTEGEPEHTLEDLIAQITPENRHSETDTGRPVGNEVWETTLAFNTEAQRGNGGPT